MSVTTNFQNTKLVNKPPVFGVRPRNRATIVTKSQLNYFLDAQPKDLILNSVSGLFLGALFTFGAVDPPKDTIGIVDYGAGVKTLHLCPPTPNCIATSEESNDQTHYTPQFTYNPDNGRGKNAPVDQKTALKELEDVVSSIKPDNFTPRIVKEKNNYLYAEYQSPTFGFIDDVEFYFPEGQGSKVEYRSASRIGESDGDINRKRIKAIREELQKKGWASVGF
eukprot:TRINITY_DN390_c0_g2_i1.p1 TRINITY_DN390_c0_g2~~TRINITY_DN390_c0_g2_i1.p1  ORF type:complete len:222 (-),score=36.67 TRINITY_DN390_c0_g2_i1:329-994(-)